MDIVKRILNKCDEDSKKFKTISVEKHLECKTDIGLLLLSDPNEINDSQLLNDKDSYLCSLTRDNTQLLINCIWDLPTERVEECIVAKLPTPTVTLPRLRKPPGQKQLTKWQKFALDKGIQKKKKAKKQFDEVLDKWVPTYGYKRIEAEKEKEWVLEVPQNIDPNEDMFQKKIDLRQEKVAKNEIQRMKNIIRAKKLEVPRTGYLGPETATSKQLITALTVAKASTASVGKFQEKLSHEKEARGIGTKELIPGAKRKMSHILKDNEKSVNLEMVKNIISKKPKIDVEKAISLQKKEQKFEREASESNKQKKGIKKAKMGKKPKTNRGQRAPGKKISHGKKRR